MRNVILFSVAGLVLVALARASASEVEGDFDWSPHAAERTVTAVTTNDDGSQRETTIWLVVVDGRAYIRTGNTRWGANAEKRPEMSIRIAAEEIPVRVDFIADAGLRGRVEAAFRAKYGFVDGLLDFLRGSNPKIMQLAPRS